MKNKEEIEFTNKHLEGYSEYLFEIGLVRNLEKHKIILKDYQKKHNLIPSIEVGNVVKNSNDATILITKIDEECNSFLGYGFGWNKDWIGFNSFFWLDSAKKVPQEEWQSMLLEKAKKDYPKGTEYYDVDCDGEEPYKVGGKFYYYNSETIEYITDGCGGSVYFNGKWASIIEQPKEDAELKNIETEIVNMRRQLKRILQKVQMLRGF